MSGFINDNDEIKKISRAWFPVKKGYEIIDGKPSLIFENKKVKKAFINKDGVNTVVLDAPNNIREQDLPYSSIDSNRPVASSVVHNGKIHVIAGGWETVGSTKYQKHYSWNGREYEDESAVQFSKNDAFSIRSVSYNNRIYVLVTKEGNTFPKFFYFDNGIWTDFTSLAFPADRRLPYEVNPTTYTMGYIWGFSGPMVVFRNKIYSTFPFRSTKTSNNITWYLCAFDSMNGSWRVANDSVPAGLFASKIDSAAGVINRSRGSAVVYNNRIHFLGGAGSPRSKRHYSYSPEEGWIIQPNLPIAYEYDSAVAYNNKIYIFSDLDCYSWKTGDTSWTKELDNPYNIAYGNVVVFDDEIEMLGGSVLTSEGGWSHYDEAKSKYHYKTNFKRYFS